MKWIGDNDRIKRIAQQHKIESRENETVKKNQKICIKYHQPIAVIALGRHIYTSVMYLQMC